MNSADRTVSMLQLQSALEASWQPDTAHLGVHEAGNPALGQCYPTSRVVQWFFPSLEIVRGQVDTGTSVEAHFWNIDPSDSPPKHIDLTWQQFPATSVVASATILDRNGLNDSAPTIRRYELLLERVLRRLATANDI